MTDGYGLPVVARLVVGEDVGHKPSNFDLALVVEFNHDADYAAYAKHAAPLALDRAVLEPVVAKRAALQCRAPRGGGASALGAGMFRSVVLLRWRRGVGEPQVPLRPEILLRFTLKAHS